MSNVHLKVRVTTSKKSTCRLECARNNVSPWSPTQRPRMQCDTIHQWRTVLKWPSKNCFSHSKSSTNLRATESHLHFTNIGTSGVASPSSSPLNHAQCAQYGDYMHAVCTYIIRTTQQLQSERAVFNIGTNGAGWVPPVSPYWNGWSLRIIRPLCSYCIIITLETLPTLFSATCRKCTWFTISWCTGAKWVIGTSW